MWLTQGLWNCQKVCDIICDLEESWSCDEENTITDCGIYATTASLIAKFHQFFFCYRTPQLNVFSMTQIWHLILCSLAYCTSHIAYYVDVLPCSCCAIVWTCGMAHGSMPDQSRAGNRTIYKYNASSLQTTAKSKKGTRTCCYMYIRQIISNFRFLFSICTCTM